MNKVGVPRPVLDVPVASRDDDAVGPLMLAVEVPKSHDHSKKQKGEVGVITIGDRTFISFDNEYDAEQYGKKVGTP